MNQAGGEWISWTFDARCGAKLCLGKVFLGELSYPHDFGLGARWKAWLNQEHLGFFRTEDEARARIEAEILKRMRLMTPDWSAFQERLHKPAPAAVRALSPRNRTEAAPVERGRRATEQRQGLAEAHSA